TLRVPIPPYIEPSTEFNTVSNERSGGHTVTQPAGQSGSENHYIRLPAAQIEHENQIAIPAYGINENNIQNLPDFLRPSSSSSIHSIVVENAEFENTFLGSSAFSDMSISSHFQSIIGGIPYAEGSGRSRVTNTLDDEGQAATDLFGFLSDFTSGTNKTQPEQDLVTTTSNKRPKTFNDMLKKLCGIKDAYITNVMDFALTTDKILKLWMLQDNDQTFVFKNPYETFDNMAIELNFEKRLRDSWNETFADLELSGPFSMFARRVWGDSSELVDHKGTLPDQPSGPLAPFYISWGQKVKLTSREVVELDRLINQGTIGELLQFVSTKISNEKWKLNTPDAFMSRIKFQVETGRLLLQNASLCKMSVQQVHVGTPFASPRASHVVGMLERNVGTNQVKMLEIGDMRADLWNSFHMGIAFLISTGDGLRLGILYLFVYVQGGWASLDFVSRKKVVDRRIKFLDNKKCKAIRNEGNAFLKRKKFTAEVSFVGNEICLKVK
ncbi:UNVERIFIED_CONTAM: hypothetical protein HDU68_004402, partial [Siphonaria sp. JEL0065]